MTDKYDDYYDSESQHGSALAACERARFEGQQRRLGYVEDHPITLRGAIYIVLFWVAVLSVGFTHGLWWALAASPLVIIFGILVGVCDETLHPAVLNRRLGPDGLCVLDACLVGISLAFFGPVIAGTIINILDTVGAMIANILYGIAVAVRG